MRYDQQQIDAFIKAHQAAVPKRQMEIYVSYWAHGKSVGQTAKELGLSLKSVTSAITRLRKNAKKGAGQ